MYVCWYALRHWYTSVHQLWANGIICIMMHNKCNTVNNKQKQSNKKWKTVKIKRKNICSCLIINGISYFLICKLFIANDVDDDDEDDDASLFQREREEKSVYTFQYLFSFSFLNFSHCAFYLKKYIWKLKYFFSYILIEAKRK